MILFGLKTLNFSINQKLLEINYFWIFAMRMNQGT